MTTTLTELPISPYKGLANYTEQDAALFFGRDREREVIIANLKARQLTVLYGESGVGKSSLLHAGVMSDLLETARRNVDLHGTPEPLTRERPRAARDGEREDDLPGHLNPGGGV